MNWPVTIKAKGVGLRLLIQSLIVHRQRIAVVLTGAYVNHPTVISRAHLFQRAGAFDSLNGAILGVNPDEFHGIMFLIITL
jgi:hypothetical protein